MERQEEGGNGYYEGTYVMGEPCNPTSHHHHHCYYYHACSATPTQSTSGLYAPVTPPRFPQNPYIPTAPPPAANQGPADIISDYLRSWTKKWNEMAKKAEVMAGSVWNHARAGSNMASTAWGKLVHVTRLLIEGGVENVYQKTFETQADEKLCKNYVCYLSTSSGPVAGMLYISTVKVAFCSDRPLAYSPYLGQTSWMYYKVILPHEKLKEVRSSSNINNPEEKYIQIVTVDGHEFWLMGFMNYEKALKNLVKAQQQQYGRGLCYST